MFTFVYLELLVDTNSHLFLKYRSAPVGEPHFLTEEILHNRMFFQYRYLEKIYSCKGARSARGSLLACLHCPIEIPFGSCIGEPHSHSVYSSTANVTVVPIFSLD